jgi:hypothetical protein
MLHDLREEVVLAMRLTFPWHSVSPQLIRAAVPMPEIDGWYRRNQRDAKPMLNIPPG